MKLKTLIAVYFAFVCTFAKGQNQFETSDIDRFRRMYDNLASCISLQDSIKMIQENYPDSASVGFQKFIRVRDLSAGGYVANFGKYPSFWKSPESNHMNLQQRRTTTDQIFDKFESEFQEFERQNVCLPIGVLTTGGTVKGNWLLIGAEIVLADSTTDTSELSSWLQEVIVDED